MSIMRWVTMAYALAAVPVLAGPPYDTDDPEPTDTGHWEFYAFAAGSRASHVLDGAAGIDINYGAIDHIQLTATLPLALTSAGSGHSGLGNIEAGAKIQFARSAHSSAAIFPRVILPTAGARFGTGHMALLLPLWGQRDFGPLSVFGGGGYTINPGRDQRDFWSQGLAVTLDINDRLSIGGEVTHFGSDAVDARAETRLGVGGIVELGGPYALLFSGGPTFLAGRSSPQAHGYVALGINF